MFDAHTNDFGTVYIFNDGWLLENRSGQIVDGFFADSYSEAERVGLDALNNYEGDAA